MQTVNSYLAFDFETTGLEPATDRIIQVGLCVVAEGQVIDRQGWLVNPGVPIPPEASRIHGVTTDAVIKHGVSPQESLTRLLAAMRSAATCIGHNIHRFDVPFLLAECRRFGVQAPNCEHFIDTAAIFKGRQRSLR